MIKINLIPTKRKKKPKPVPTFVIGMVLLLVFSIILSAYASYFLNSRIEELKAKKADNEKKIAELNKTIAEIKGFEQRNKVFTDRKNIIEELTKNQSLPVRVLDEMSKRLTDGIWVTSLKISRGTVSVAGVGFTNSDIVTYVQSLKDSAMFNNVVLLGTAAQDISGVGTYTFNISFAVAS